MRRFILLPLLLLFMIPSSVSALRADTGDLLEPGQTVGVSLAPVFSWVNGTAYELVYGTQSLDKPYLSKLTWQLEHVFTAGMKGSLNLGNVLYFNGAFSTALTVDSGEMNDYDWIYSSYPSYYPGRTHWSRSDISLNGSWQIDFNTAVRVYRTQDLRFDFLTGFRFINWSWTDILREAEYPDRDLSHLYGTNGIDYEVTYRIPYVGAGFGWTDRFFSGELTVLYSWMVSGEDHDFHKLRTNPTHYYDYYSGGRYLGLNAAGRFAWSRYFSLSLAYEWDQIFEMVGDTLTVEELSSTVRSYSFRENGAGARYIAGSLTLSVEYRY